MTVNYGSTIHCIPTVRWWYTCRNIRSYGIITRYTHKVVPPSDVSWFINPMNTIDIYLP